MLASGVPADAINDAVEATGKGGRRRGGKLPPRVVAYLVMALTLFADEDCEEVAARLARAYAVTGRGAETRGALARAEDVLSQFDGDSLIPSAFGYSEASFRFHEGNAYTHLGDFKSAMHAQDRALELCAPDNYADWAMTRLDRAQCLICAGDVTSGLEYANETVTTITAAQRQGIIALRGREIIKTLALSLDATAGVLRLKEPGPGLGSVPDCPHE